MRSKEGYDISQVSSAVSREWNWPTCDFNHITNRNRLPCATGEDILKCIAVNDSLTQSKKSATMLPTFSGLQMRILSDEVWHMNVFELLRTTKPLEIFWTLYLLVRNSQLWVDVPVFGDLGTSVHCKCCCRLLEWQCGIRVKFAVVFCILYSIKRICYNITKFTVANVSRIHLIGWWIWCWMCEMIELGFYVIRYIKRTDWMSSRRCITGWRVCIQLCTW